jgi:hypothetical protein
LGDIAKLTDVEKKYLLFDNSSPSKEFFKDVEKTSTLNAQQLKTIFSIVARSIFSKDVEQSEIEEFKKKSKISESKLKDVVGLLHYLLAKLSSKLVPLEIAKQELIDLSIPDKIVDALITTFDEYSDQLWNYSLKHHLTISPTFYELSWRVSLQYQESPRAPILKPLISFRIKCYSTNDPDENKVTFSFDVLEDGLDELLYELNRAKDAFDKLKKRNEDLSKILLSDD